MRTQELADMNGKYAFNLEEFLLQGSRPAGGWDGDGQCPGDRQRRPWSRSAPLAVPRWSLPIQVSQAVGSG